MPYEVLKEMHHLGRRYLPGEPVALKPHDVFQLVAKGYVREVPPPIPVQEMRASTAGGQAASVDKPATKPIQPAAPRGRLSVGD